MTALEGSGISAVENAARQRDLRSRAPPLSTPTLTANSKSVGTGNLFGSGTAGSWRTPTWERLR